MARQPEAQTLTTAWRALAGHSGSGEWCTIPVVADSSLRVLAARQFPGNNEAILVGFDGSPPTPSGMPQGSGYVVRSVEGSALTGGKTWLALVRRPAGGLDLFTVLAADVVRNLVTASGAGEGDLAAVFLRRIHAWQNFMQDTSQAPV